MIELGITGNTSYNTTQIVKNISRSYYDNNKIVCVLNPFPFQSTDPRILGAMVIGDIKVITSGKGEPTYEGLTSTTKEASVINNFEQRIFKKLIFPDYWEYEGVLKPNLSAKKNAYEICKEIFKKYDLEPDRILASRENGIFIAYDFVTDSSERSLIIETYNNLETAVVVSDNANKKILYSEDIYGLNFENAIQAFKEKIC